MTARGSTGGDAPAVLIIGAGPTGLTLACELARRAVPFRLVEAAPGPQPGSRGKGLQPRSLEVLDDLGVVDGILAHGRMGMPVRSTGPDGEVVESDGGVPAPRPDVPYRASVVTPQWRVEEALRARLAELGGRVEFGVRLSGLEQSEDSVTAVVDRNGAAETVTAQWLVGCDGGHSLVRKQAGIVFEGDTLEDVRMIVADLAVDGLDREVWHMWRSQQGFLALCPLPSTDLFQFQAGIAAGQDPALEPANLQAIVEQRSHRADIRLHRPQWSSLWRANVRLANRYRHGRALLAGDAAHIHSPAGGQGMNTGIQDAHNLGWKLAAVAAGADSGLLDTYEEERRPVAAGVLALSNARLAQTLRDNAIPTRRDTDTTQLGVNYRSSRLARDDRRDGAALRAGDRAPDATGLQTVEGVRRLFDLTRGGRFTLIEFGATTVPGVPSADLTTLRVVPDPREPGEVADTNGHLAEAYAATSATLVLVRPDGHVGLISDAGDVAAVTDYLTAVGSRALTPASAPPSARW